jgi:flagellar hook assembly protein FlgD
VATNVDSQVPLSFGLQQNYPNPFNPSTTIELSVPEQSHLAMKIFDVLGREVVALLDGERAPGIYRISWDGKNGGGVPVQSGVYYCRLIARTQAGQVFTQTRRMTVVK